MPPPSTAAIRPAHAADVPAIQQAVRLAYSPYIPRIGRPPGPMSDDYGQRVADGHIRVVEQSGEVVGLLVIVPQADHLQLDNVALLPAAQGQGLGRLLLDEAERVARGLGLGAIRLYTHELMTENIERYTRAGYVETHRAEDDGFRRVYMAKALT